MKRQFGDEDVRGVKVVWEDCTAQDTYATKDEALTGKLMVMVTRGSYIGETDKCVAVGRDYIPADQRFRDISWIPKVNILEMCFEGRVRRRKKQW